MASEVGKLSQEQTGIHLMHPKFFHSFEQSELRVILSSYKLKVNFFAVGKTQTVVIRIQY